MNALQDKPAPVSDNSHPASIKETVVAGLETAKEKVVEGYEKVSHKAHEVWDKASDTSLNEVRVAVKQYVRHHPGRCLLIAAGAGLALGLVLRGRMGHRG